MGKDRRRPRARRSGAAAGRGPRPAPAAVVAAGLLAATLTGCVTVVRPPAAPADPVEVYLLDHGRTPSLVLPGGDGGSTRWAYGDWRWYALGEHGLREAVAALLWPTRAGLGRQELVAAAEAPAVREALSVPVEELYTIRVERGQAAALAERLDRLIRLRSATLATNEDSGLDFVHHPVPYTLLHNSNRVVASWLRELGCEVRGRAILSRWRLVRPRNREATEPARYEPAVGGTGQPPGPRLSLQTGRPWADATGRSRRLAAAPEHLAGGPPSPGSWEDGARVAPRAGSAL